MKPTGLLIAMLGVLVGCVLGWTYKPDITLESFVPYLLSSTGILFLLYILFWDKRKDVWCFLFHRKHRFVWQCYCHKGEASCPRCDRNHPEPEEE